MNIVLHILYTLHLLAAMVLMGAVGMRLLWAYLPKQAPPSQNPKLISYLLLLQMLIGGYLVHTRHHSFHTPWIQGAYILVGLTLAMNVYITRHPNSRAKSLLNGLMLLLLALTAYEAITRSNAWL